MVEWLSPFPWTISRSWLLYLASPTIDVKIQASNQEKEERRESVELGEE